MTIQKSKLNQNKPIVHSRKEIATDEELMVNQWYAIFLSKDLKNKPVSIKRLGINFVLWRDREEIAHMAKAGCPHRGANLGLGAIKDGELQCKYHGFRFNHKGICTITPCQGSSAPVPPSLNLKLLKIKEYNGFIWYWHSDKAPNRDIPQIKGAFLPGANTSTYSVTWDIRLSRVMEGMMDLHHLPFAHSPWIPKKLTRLDPYTVQIEDNIIYTEGTLKDENNPKNKGISASINIGFPSLLHIAMDKKFATERRKNRDTKYGFEMIGTCTPVDKDNTWIGLYYQQSYTNLPLLGPVFNYLALQLDLKLIQPDDYLLLKSSEPRSSSPGTNHLVHADMGIGAWHRLRSKALKELEDQPEYRFNAETQVSKTEERETEANTGCSF